MSEYEYPLIVKLLLKEQQLYNASCFYIILHTWSVKPGVISFYLASLVKHYNCDKPVREVAGKEKIT